jgi:para-nitrobenzyl esterase
VGYNRRGPQLTRCTPDEYVAASARVRPFADADRGSPRPPTVPKTARDLAGTRRLAGRPGARLQASRGKGKAFLYYFDQHPDRAPGSPEADHGAPHGVDVPYVFETLEDSGRPVTDADRRISEAMAAYWTNFAKRGDPNGDGLGLAVVQ